MNELTDRQKQILQSVINEYVEGASPVGSEVLAQKYNLGVSPATLRNEMAALTHAGFLEKPHASAGRIPSDLGFRYYIKNLMQEQEIPVMNEVAIKQRIWANRHDQEKMLKSAVQSLADESQHLSLSATNESRIYVAGAVHILRHPEFYDIDLTRAVLHLLDQTDLILEMFGRLPNEQDFGILLGEEMGFSSMNPCGLVFTRFSLPRGVRGQIGVLGPVRLEYPKIVPLVRYFGELMKELGAGW